MRQKANFLLIQQVFKCSATPSYSKYVNDQSKSSVLVGECLAYQYLDTLYVNSFRYNLRRYMGPPEMGGGGGCIVTKFSCRYFERTLTNSYLNS
jgi:hypothetical protein